MNALLIDQMILSNQQVFSPFALTDVLSEFAGDNDQELIHFWQLEQTFILGMKDARVPDLSAGLLTVQQKAYQPILRNAGGLGVVSDKGILNVSLIVPNHGLSIDAGYEKMVAWLRATWPELTIEAGEIATSYCPGKYDLAVAGKKIAGIAQRRVKNGAAIMLYLSVNGDQRKRGELVRTFYEQSQADTKKIYPAVNPSSMTTLSQLLGRSLSIAEAKQQLLATRDVHDQSQKVELFFETPDYQQRLKNMVARNQIIKENLHAEL